MRTKSERPYVFRARLFFLAVGSVALIGQAHAQYTGPAPRSAAPSGRVVVTAIAPHISTVEQALTAWDESIVVIEGQIVNKIRHEHYTFRDDAGKSIEIELDDKYLPPGQVIDETTRVRLTGEVDQNSFRPSEIDVKRIEIIK